MTAPPLNETDLGPGPSPTECIQAIVAAEGDLHIAAERLFGREDPRQPNTKRALLIATIASDPPSVGILKENLRTLAMLQAFSSASAVGVAVNGTLENQSPHDLIKLYTSLMGILATFTDDHKSTIEGNFQSLSLTADVVLSKFPKDVQDAIKVLLQPEAPPDSHSNVIEIKAHEGRSLGELPSTG